MFLNGQGYVDINLEIFLSVVRGWAEDPLAGFWN